MKTVVIGGGAAGMTSAYFAAKCGEEVVLLEQNEKLGKKIYITGKGRCNVTNDCDEGEVLENIVTNAPFMRGAIYNFPPEKTMNLLTEAGLKIKTERGNRVFPLSDKSSDVIKTFEKLLIGAKVEICLNTQVYELLTSNGAIKGVRCSRGEILCDRVIVCTGGMSYPTTGSCGDGYKFAKSSGHTINRLRPALCGLDLVGENFPELSGLSLKNISYKVYKDGKVIYNDFGELLFTHTGISGPVVISGSSFMSKAGDGDYEVSIDLKPSLDERILDMRILRDFKEFLGKTLKNSLIKLLPKSLISEVILKARLDGDKRTSELTVAERKSLVNTLKNLRYKVRSLRPLAESIVTGGGVEVKEINPKTMESKIVRNLYFAGEVLDVDALTGGFNLQCAFAMGYVAGNGGNKA